MDGKAKILVVGCGGISNAWLGPITKRDDCLIVGLTDLNRDVATKRKSDYNLSAAEVFTDYREAIRESAADFVLNLTVPECHHEVGMYAMENGSHVLSEKPLANSMSQARELRAMADSSGSHYAVMQNRRFSSAGMRIFRTLREAPIGRLTTLKCDFYLGPHFGGFRDEMQNVLLYDMAIHHFDMARFFSQAEPVNVFCKEWNPVGSWYRHGASAMAIFEFSGDLVFGYSGSWCAEGCMSSWQGSWRFVGEHGTVLWDGEDQIAVEIVRKQAGFHSELATWPAPEPGEKMDGHTGCINHMFDSIASGRRPATDIRDNIRSLAMVFGAIESAEKKSLTLLEAE